VFEPGRIVHSVRTLGSHEAVFGPAIAQRLIECFSSSPTVSPQAFPSRRSASAKRSSSSLRGESNAALAQRLVISPEDRAQYVSNALTKPRVADRARERLG
jgi:DNA-binding NarL/FixJ family response regulator